MLVYFVYSRFTDVYSIELIMLTNSLKFSAKLLLAVLLSSQSDLARGQDRVAVLDFENTSSDPQYASFGKAMSNMLITDMTNAIHPRKATFFERNQLNQILNEQGLQQSSQFDKNTAVQIGKLTGVDYIVIGSVFVLEGQCSVNSRMVDVATSAIIHAKESNGSISSWLTLKTELAKELSEAINCPITVADIISNGPTDEAVLKQYAGIIDDIDAGELEEAEKLSAALAAIVPEFGYFGELLYDLEQLKKQVEANTASIEVLNKSGGLVIDAKSYNELKNNLRSVLSSRSDQISIVQEMALNYPQEFSSDLDIYYQWPDIILDHDIVGALKNEAEFNQSMCGILKPEQAIRYIRKRFFHFFWKLAQNERFTELPLADKLPTIEASLRPFLELIDKYAMDEKDKALTKIRFAKEVLPKIVGRTGPLFDCHDGFRDGLHHPSDMMNTNAFAEVRGLPAFSYLDDLIIRNINVLMPEFPFLEQIMNTQVCFHSYSRCISWVLEFHECPLSLGADCNPNERYLLFDEEFLWGVYSPFTEAIPVAMMNSSLFAIIPAESGLLESLFTFSNGELSLVNQNIQFVQETEDRYGNKKRGYWTSMKNSQNVEENGRILGDSLRIGGQTLHGTKFLSFYSKEHSKTLQDHNGLNRSGNGYLSHDVYLFRESEDVGFQFLFFN